MPQYNKNVFGSSDVICGTPFDDLTDRVQKEIKIKYQQIPSISIQTLRGKNVGINTFHFQLPVWDDEYTPLRIYFTITKSERENEDKKEILPFFKNFVIQPIKGTNYEYNVEEVLNYTPPGDWLGWAFEYLKKINDKRTRNIDFSQPTGQINSTFIIFGYNYEENRIYMKMRKGDDVVWYSNYYTLKGYFLLQKNE